MLHRYVCALCHTHTYTHIRIGTHTIIKMLPLGSGITGN